MRRFLLTVLLLIAVTTVAVAFQRQWRRRQAPDRSEYPQWKIDEQFEEDVFTFARVRFGASSGRGGWSNDFPDCDWNFSARLQELTSFQVDPNGAVVELLDPELFDYPFLYISHPDGMDPTDEECVALRAYLQNGGFIMGDDFWAERSWRLVRELMNRVLPDCEPVELDRDHPLFHVVYDLKVKPQVPSIMAWRRGLTYEDWHGPYDGDTEPHFQAYLDEHGRIMALMCHNNDIGDGWEREGEEKEYFLRYSEQVSYPLGINIITYVMTN